MRWFRSISKGRVHEIYLAEGGATSVYMAGILFAKYII